VTCLMEQGRKHVVGAAIETLARDEHLAHTRPRLTGELYGGQEHNVGVRSERCAEVVIVDRVAEGRACTSKRIGIAVAGGEPSPAREVTEPHQPGDAARGGSSDGENHRRHFAVACAYRSSCDGVRR
jgi:hypothetical protein